jgi:hypothetical protein
MGVGAIIGAWQGNWRLLEFLVLLIALGAIYGALYTLGLALRHRAKFLASFKHIIRTPKVHRVRIALVVTGIAIVALAILAHGMTRVLLGALLLALYALTYAWIAITAVEQGILLKEYAAGKLTEGDWLAHDVRARGKLIAPKRAIGLTKEDIAAIRRAKVRRVLVREGIPFVPSFLFAFCALLALEKMGIGLFALL